jgi:hypothetical protein
MAQARAGTWAFQGDSVIPTFTRWGFAKAHPELYTEQENEACMTVSYMIGGMMVARPNASRSTVPP